MTKDSAKRMLDELDALRRNERLSYIHTLTRREHACSRLSHDNQVDSSQSRTKRADELCRRTWAVVRVARERWKMFQLTKAKYKHAMASWKRVRVEREREYISVSWNSLCSKHAIYQADLFDRCWFEANKLFRPLKRPREVWQWRPLVWLNKATRALQTNWLWLGGTQYQQVTTEYFAIFSLICRSRPD